MSAWLACAMTLMTGPRELMDYVRKPDSSFTWHTVSRSGRITELALTSQTWQGHEWKHSLLVMEPPTPTKCRTVILYVTGDRVDRADLPFIQSLADKSGLRVATLFDIPNQPIFDQREDALIAYTFGKFMESGDPTWPLLFPMVKSTVRAMDALERYDRKIGKFVVTGGSKRGWTTWLAAATGDRRIAGIAPMVFDFLGFEKQLKHQMDSWGKYSEMLEDYVASGQTEATKTPEGRRLAAMVDPYSYLDGISIPKLIVLGGNDRYWSSDAHRLYLPAVRGTTFMRVIPNVGHNLGDGEAATAAIAFFARGVARTLAKANQTWFDRGVAPAKGQITWRVGSSIRDFRDGRWTTAKPNSPWSASFEEFPLADRDLKASFTSPVTISKS